MATLINGHLHGKIGKVVACKYKNKEGGYFRTAPVRKKPPTEHELENRYKFAMVQAWIKPIKTMLRLGFQNQTEGVNGIPAGVGYIRKHAVKGEGFESYIDPSSVRISQGDLQLPANIQVELNEEDVLQFTWDVDLDPDRNASDTLMLLAYNTRVGLAVQKLAAATRLQGWGMLDLEPMAPGPYHLYVAFRSADGTRQSNSMYLGAVEI